MTVDDDDADQAKSLRAEELQVLESIYPDYIVHAADDTLRLEVPVELGCARNVVLDTEDTPGRPGTADDKTRIELAHLPPILLSLSLPAAYPLRSSPLITSVYVTNSWLPRVSRLQQLLLQTWTKGEGVICEWVELIRSGDILEKLGLVDDYETIRLPYPDPQLLASALSAYDESASTAEFSQNAYPCSICFLSVRGSKCVKLSCSHVFCRPCLQEYWGFCIAEGDVGKVACADEQCVKEGRQAEENEVRRVVSDDEVIRWKWLRAKKIMEKDPTILHCPIPMCQAAVPKPPNENGQTSGWDRFRSCTACGYNFCSFCRRTWHGPISECPKSYTVDLVQEYLALPEDSSERLLIEQRYGKGVVAKLVKEYEDEKSTGAWLASSTMSCPGCGVHVEKSLGCNHMTCAKCTQHFCYRCGCKLDASDPYKHFSRKGSECFGLLFELTRGDEEWQPVEGFDFV